MTTTVVFPAIKPARGTSNWDVHYQSATLYSVFGEGKHLNEKLKKFENNILGTLSTT